MVNISKEMGVANLCLTGLGARCVMIGTLTALQFGYFVQGWFKFGGVELIKIKCAESIGEKAAWDNRTSIYLGAAAGAEFVADVFLCPLEACRIRSVSDPGFAPSLAGVAGRLVKEEGVLRGFYSGFGPILFKQIPYTMAKFAVQGLAAEKMYDGMGKQPADLSGTMNTCVSLASGTIAGVVAAIISHPADTLLSKVNKKGAGGDGSVVSRMVNISKEMGVANLCLTGLNAMAAAMKKAMKTAMKAMRAKAMKAAAMKAMKRAMKKAAHAEAAAPMKAMKRRRAMKSKKPSKVVMKAKAMKAKAMKAPMKAAAMKAMKRAMKRAMK